MTSTLPALAPEHTEVTTIDIGQTQTEAPKQSAKPTTAKAPPAEKSSISEWKKIIAPYTVPSLPRALWQVANTLIPYAAMWVIMNWSLSVSYWLTLALAIPAGFLVVRAFIIFHDCGHGSFFKSKKANDLLGFLTGMLTFTPYGHWTWQHAVHHQTSGDLDRRGEGDIWTLTVNEYLQSSPRRRFLYRFMRNPVILFIVAPLIMFFGYQRLCSPHAKGKDRKSVYLMNVALACMVGGMMWLLGWKQYLMIQVPITMFAGMAGIWMFYVQHQFEDVYWEHRDEWDYTTAAIEGSSFYKLPKILQWCTGNIGFHHVHHLSSRIPNYYLEACHLSHPMFYSVKPITFLSSLKCMNLRLFDEETKRLIGYRELREIRKDREAKLALAA